MKIDSSLIEAFVLCSESESISIGAKSLGITQSAMTQRIQRLEERLGSSLIIRQKSGLTLTEAGTKLLRYAKVAAQLELETLAEIDAFQDELSGTIRIAAFSSILRSAIIPALTSFLIDNKKVSIEFKSYEVIELENVLMRGGADFVVADYRFQKGGIAETLLGNENYVVINSANNPCSEEIYLDHGPHDNATASFFNFQNKKPKFYRRTFMGDVYGIIDGVASGLGKAVMSEHLIKKRKDIKIVSGYKKYQREVVLHHFEQPYYPKVWEVIIKKLRQAKYLNV